jgi:hypothetical protein
MFRHLLETILVPLTIIFPIVLIAAALQLFAIKKQLKRIADHLSRASQP